MPEDKARKRAVRARMAQTGERYTTAARKLGAPAYDTNDPCPYCTCCSAYGCHPNPDSGCPWSERLGDFACPCTGGPTRASGEKMLTEQGEQLDKTLKAQSGQLDRTSTEQRTRTLNERFEHGRRATG